MSERTEREYGTLFADGLSMADGAVAAVEAWLQRLPASMSAADLRGFAREVEDAVATQRAGFSPPEFWADFAAALRAVADEKDGHGNRTKPDAD